MHSRQKSNLKTIKFQIFLVNVVAIWIHRSKLKITSGKFPEVQFKMTFYDYMIRTSSTGKFLII